MIRLALRLLRDELSEYVFQNRMAGDSITPEDVILHNIALMDGDNQGDLDDKIIMTLVNTEEESALKNKSHVLKTPKGIKYLEPPVFLNMYVLISATLGQDSKDAYEFALDRLSLVIQFFQAKRKFTVKNSPFSTIVNDSNISDEQKEKLKLHVELYTLTFEQINHLWGSLGGKQTPFAMYKIRLVGIQERTTFDAPLIEEIENNSHLIDPQSV